MKHLKMLGASVVALMLVASAALGQNIPKRIIDRQFISTDSLTVKKNLHLNTFGHAVPSVGDVWTNGSTLYFYGSGGIVDLGGGGIGGTMTGSAIMDSLNGANRSVTSAWTFRTSGGFTARSPIDIQTSTGSEDAYLINDIAATRNIYLPRGTGGGRLGYENMLGLRPIDSTAHGIYSLPGPGKMWQIDDNGAWALVDSSRFQGGGVGGSGTWGSITGTLSNQTDLWNVLAAKQGTNLTTNWMWVGLGGTAVQASITGDLSLASSGGGPYFAGFTINPNAVTLADMAQIPTGYWLGRTSAGTGNVEAITTSALKSALLLNNVDNVSVNTGFYGSLIINTLGVIATGTWHGSTIDIPYGGTNATTANGALNNLLPTQTGNNGKFLQTNGSNTSWQTVSGSGTVTSFSASFPTQFSSSVTNPTTTPSLNVTWNSQVANTIFAGPSSGAAAVPTFRSSVFADAPWVIDSVKAYGYRMPRSFSGSMATVIRTVGGVTDSLMQGPKITSLDTDSLISWREVRGIIPASSDSSRASYKAVVADSVRGKMGQSTVLPSWADTVHTGAGTSVYFQNGQVHTQAAGGGVTGGGTTNKLAVWTSASALGANSSTNPLMDSLVWGKYIDSDNKDFYAIAQYSQAHQNNLHIVAGHTDGYTPGKLYLNAGDASDQSTVGGNVLINGGNGGAGYGSVLIAPSGGTIRYGTTGKSLDSMFTARETMVQMGTDSTNIRNQSNALYESKTQMGTDSTNIRNQSNSLYKLKSEIKTVAWTQLDSSVINTTDKYPLVVTGAFTADSIVTEGWDAQASAVTPLLHYGSDISATGTAFTTQASFTTANTTRVVIADATVVPSGARVWLTFSAATTKPSKFSIYVKGH